MLSGTSAKLHLSSFRKKPWSLICHWSSLPCAPACPATSRLCLIPFQLHLRSHQPVPGPGPAAAVLAADTTRNDTTVRNLATPSSLFPWKIILAYIFVWSNIGKAYLNDNCTQILPVKRDKRNPTEAVQEAAWSSLLYFLLLSFLCFPAHQAEAPARQHSTVVSATSFLPTYPCQVPQRAAAGFLLPGVRLSLFLNSLLPAIPAFSPVLLTFPSAHF